MAKKKYKIPYSFEVHGILEISADDSDDALLFRDGILFDSKRALSRSILDRVQKGSVKIKNK